MDFFAKNIILIFILPLLSAICAYTAHIFKYGISKKAVTALTISSTCIGLLFSLSLNYLYSYMETEPYEIWLNIFRVGNLPISAGILLDKLSTLFLLFIMLISLVVQIFAAFYMQDKKRYTLYLCILNLITLTTEGFFLSTNIIQTYIFGAISGVMTYYLINFEYENKQNANRARASYITSKIGDMMFLTGIIVFMYFIANYPVSEGDVLLSYSSLRDSAADFYVYMSDENFYIVCLLLLGGTIAKAAQFPLHTWLEKASQAELPSFILINSVLSIPSGIFILFRLMPLYELSSTVLKTILYIGLFTGFISSLFALGQKEVKKLFAYISSAQAGITVAATATVIPSAALLYLFSNIVALTLILLIIGLILYFIKKEENINISVSKTDYPLLAICYLIATVSSAGMFFGGFNALYGIFSINIQNHTNNIYVAILFFITIFLIAFCIFKSYFKTFGEKSSSEKVKIPTLMNVIIVIFTILMISVTFYNFESFNHIDNVIKSDLINDIFNIFPYTLISAVGAALLSCLFVANKISFVPQPIKNFSLNGGYISILYEKISDSFIDLFGNITKGFDKYILNFNIAGYIARFMSWCISVSQCGNIQTYISYALITIGVFIVLYILLIVGFGVI